MRKWERGTNRSDFRVPSSAFEVRRGEDRSLRQGGGGDGGQPRHRAGHRRRTASGGRHGGRARPRRGEGAGGRRGAGGRPLRPWLCVRREPRGPDRKSTRLNSSHGYISYAVFCLKKKKK